MRRLLLSLLEQLTTLCFMSLLKHERTTALGKTDQSEENMFDKQTYDDNYYIQHPYDLITH